MTRVVHVRKSEFDVYIGRAFAEFDESIWANPFHIGLHGNRKEVIAKYREHILSHPDLVLRIQELRGKTLGCWCKPRWSCHGDVLAELADRPQLNIENVGIVPEGVDISWDCKYYKQGETTMTIVVKETCSYCGEPFEGGIPTCYCCPSCGGTPDGDWDCEDCRNIRDKMQAAGDKIWKAWLRRNHND